MARRGDGIRRVTFEDFKTKGVEAFRPYMAETEAGGQERRVMITGLFDFFDVSAKELASAPLRVTGNEHPLFGG